MAGKAGKQSEWEISKTRSGHPGSIEGVFFLISVQLQPLLGFQLSQPYLLLMTWRLPPGEHRKDTEIGISEWGGSMAKAEATDFLVAATSIASLLKFRWPAVYMENILRDTFCSDQVNVLTKSQKKHRNLSFLY